jgi:hypothetical protein
MEHPHYHKLTTGDVKAIRAQVACARFLHLPRLASEWGLSVEFLKTLIRGTEVKSSRQQ